MNLELIDKQVNDIIYGTTDIPRFNQQEHAGICSAGSSLIGALLVCYDTRKSLETSADASGGKGTPTNWEIDEAQEQAVQNWAEAKNIWVPDCENWLIANYGQMIAEGAEAKVFYRSGDIAVIKERASIYATLGRALEAIALHNYLFPETMMRVIGFTRDSDGLFRTILTQPYVECQRLATKQEIDAMVSLKGFYDNGDGNGVNYLSDRLHLEDMHPANVFIDKLTSKPICIDCIVKFRKH